MSTYEKEILENRDIVAYLQSGDSRSYEVLFDRYGAMLFGIISRIVKNDKDAENLLQDCFVKIWRNVASYDAEKGRFTTWIINIARNTAIDFTRSKFYLQRGKNQNLDNFVSSSFDVSDAPISPDTLDLRQIIAKIPPQYQQIIDLMYFGGYTQQEISDEFNIPLGTVKTRARLALIELRQHFGEDKTN